MHRALALLLAAASRAARTRAQHVPRWCDPAVAFICRDATGSQLTRRSPTKLGLFGGGGGGVFSSSFRAYPVSFIDRVRPATSFTPALPCCVLTRRRRLPLRSRS